MRYQRIITCHGEVTKRTRRGSGRKYGSPDQTTRRTGQCRLVVNKEDGGQLEQDDIRTQKKKREEERAQWFHVAAHGRRQDATGPTLGILNVGLSFVHPLHPMHQMYRMQNEFVADAGC